MFCSKRRKCKFKFSKEVMDAQLVNSVLHTHFLVQFNGEPLAQTIFTSHPSPRLAYGEVTVLREVIQFFSPASLRARHVYTANVAATAILFPIYSFPSLAVKPLWNKVL